MSKHRDYVAAQAALGVKKVEISSLLRKHKDFRARSCEAFEAFLAPKGAPANTGIGTPIWATWTR